MSEPQGIEDLGNTLRTVLLTSLSLSEALSNFSVHTKKYEPKYVVLTAYDEATKISFVSELKGNVVRILGEDNPELGISCEGNVLWIPYTSVEVVDEEFKKLQTDTYVSYLA